MRMLNSVVCETGLLEFADNMNFVREKRQFHATQKALMRQDLWLARKAPA